MTHISDIKLIRTDTTLDLSQKAEKGQGSSATPRQLLKVPIASYRGEPPPLKNRVNIISNDVAEITNTCYVTTSAKNLTFCYEETKTSVRFPSGAFLAGPLWSAVKINCAVSENLGQGSSATPRQLLKVPIASYRGGPFPSKNRVNIM
ncbi:hypothetical protein H5410_035306 [Solanum commersonii]|uniref:Uncharacterized protein n=1 Tax=Solanum commersonii TaxID=4109 RepID=A0A9J5Y2B0_SOLCO|nr:hypothetical protein H5410_035306 [Solanum commersonii]